MGDALVISGAPAVTSLNGVYYLMDPAATGTSRVWGNVAQMRVYYDNGWSIGNSADGVVYFKQSPAEEVDPWDIPTGRFSTTIDAYQEFTDLIQINRQDDGETKTYELTTFKSYELTTDTVFLQGKTYYTRVGHGTDTNPYSYNQVEVEPGEAVPANTYFEEFDVTQEKEIYRDPRTNSVRTVSNQTRISSLPVTDVHERYAVPDLSAGKVYRFTFVRDFKELGYIPPQSDDYTLADDQKDSDITRGVYKVDKVMTYYTLVIEGIDVYQNLYIPLGISRDIFEQDQATWKNDDIWYRLINPALPAQIRYVPTSIIEGIPDGNVTEYKRHHLITDIGLFDDPTMLAEMVTAINLLFQAKFGLDTASELTSYDSVWIPTTYYEWMEESRKMKQKEFMQTQSERYYQTLFSTEWNRLLRENDELTEKIRGYEEVLNPTGD